MKMKMIKFVVLIWLACCGILLCRSLSTILDPKELMILSILDFSNEVVVRDLMTMIRSLRLFGGKLNEATVVVGVVSSVHSSNDSSHYYGSNQFRVLEELSMLSVEVEFLDGNSHGHGQSRTMNKLSAFRLFDSLRFSHVLWLDADILVLNDPTPFLTRHVYPGSIDCVPEIYNYMRRYPILNSTEMLWNPKLAAITLVGADEMSPAGTCNTGVMLFDSVVLAKLVKTIERLKTENIVPEIYRNDRFLDSLFFVLAVNEASIHINYLPYSFNYMAFFIGEYQTLKMEIDEIYFAHFLWEPFFYCSTLVSELNRTSGAHSCVCISKNEHERSDDLLYRSIQSAIIANETACKFLAGDYDPIEFQRLAILFDEQEIERNSYENNRDLLLTANGLSPLCYFLWPPIQHGQKVISSQQFVSLSFIMLCNHENSTEGESLITKISNLEGVLSLSLGDSINVVHNAVIKFEEFDGYIDIHSHSSGLNSRSQYFRSPTIDVTVVSSKQSSNSYGVSNFFVSAENLTAVLQFSLDIAFVNGSTKQYVNNSFRSKLSIYDESKFFTPKRAMFSVNPLRSSKSLSLSTQLLVPEFLVAAGMLDNNFRAIILCCDTAKGVQTTQRLLKQFSAKSIGMVVLIITSIPNQYLSNSTFQSSLSSELSAHDSFLRMFGTICSRSSPFGKNPCHIISLLSRQQRILKHPKGQFISSVMDHLQQILDGLKPNSFSFLYIDSFLLKAMNAQYIREVVLLGSVLTFINSCRRILISGGESLIIGSSYFSAADSININDDGEFSPLYSTNAIRQDLYRRLSPDDLSLLLWQHQFVLQLSLRLNIPTFFTHSENLSTFCTLNKSNFGESIDWWRECSPAWYFFV